MDHREFSTAIKRLFGTEARAARELGINPRTMRKYTADPATVSATNALRVPDTLVAEVRDLLALFPDGVRTIDPRKSLRVLYNQMLAAGWPPDQAGAGILGAATALAQSIPGATPDA